jgi:hypothetical protein
MEEVVLSHRPHFPPIKDPPFFLAPLPLIDVVILVKVEFPK